MGSLARAGRAAGATDDAGGSKFRLKIRKPAPGLAGTPPTIPADSARQATKAAHEAARDVCKQGSKRKAAGETGRICCRGGRQRRNG